MADMNFDFNGDSLAPEQDHLFDDLLDDLAFESEIGTYGNNFLGTIALVPKYFSFQFDPYLPSHTSLLICRL